MRTAELLDGMRKASPKRPLYSCSGHRNTSRLFHPIQSPQNFSLSREQNEKTHRAANAHHLTNATWEQPRNQGGMGRKAKNTHSNTIVVFDLNYFCILSAQNTSL